MKRVLNDFDERVKEVDRYLRLLRLMDKPNTRFAYLGTNGRRHRAIDGECYKILKATTFLLIYNLIESSVRNALRTVYEQMRNDRCTCEDLTDTLRSLWIEQQYRAIDPKAASPLKYQSTAQELIKHAVNKLAIDMQEAKLPISGNLDAEQVRQLCYKHGVSAKTHRAAQGGYHLDAVRKQRNALAHGDISFSECGRQYTVDDLNQIKIQAVIFLRGILNNIRRFAEGAKYRARKAGAKQRPTTIRTI